MSDDNILRISPEGDIFQSSLDQGPRLCCCLGRAGFHHYSNSAIKKVISVIFGVSFQCCILQPWRQNIPHGWLWCLRWQAPRRQMCSGALKFPLHICLIWRIYEYIDIEYILQQSNLRVPHALWENPPRHLHIFHIYLHNRSTGLPSPWRKRQDNQETTAVFFIELTHSKSDHRQSSGECQTPSATLRRGKEVPRGARDHGTRNYSKFE